MKKLLPFVAPFLVALFGVLLTALSTMNVVYISGIKTDVKDINTKLFSHFTNDEIHMAKSDICSALQQQYDRLHYEEELRHKTEEKTNYGRAN